MSKYFKLFSFETEEDLVADKAAPRGIGWRLPPGMIRGNHRKRVRVNGWEYYNFLGVDYEGFFRYENKRKVK